ncbi:DNA-binding protein inhibitor ID-3-A [Taenia crassiceps]|uniref:DNA-binding protein inhibitor ID-3-A n=1 Tax=Taenia crassiceps TaxID=6207 RepID=A0ABR4QE25_9CEST
MKARPVIRRKPCCSGSAIDRCLVQLKRMVPAVRGHTRIKKLELLQHVIDYIQDLELTLAEDHLRKSSVSSSPPSTQRNVLTPSCSNPN